MSEKLQKQVRPAQLRGPYRLASLLLITAVSWAATYGLAEALFPLPKTAEAPEIHVPTVEELFMNHYRGADSSHTAVRFTGTNTLTNTLSDSWLTYGGDTVTINGDLVVHGNLRVLDTRGEQVFQVVSP